MPRRHFMLNILGDEYDPSLAFVDERPDDVPWAHRLAMGEPLGADAPDEIRLRMAASARGLRLGSMLGNSIGYLLLDTAMKEAVADLFSEASERVEMLPFVLYNHKKRVHSRDYWIVNPLGTFDCVHRAESDIRYLEPDEREIVAIRRFVFDIRRLDDAPDLFRVPEDRSKYFISERVGAAWQGLRCTNVFLHEIEQR